MSRIRTFKPEFWSSERLTSELTRDQRLLYMGLWTEADDYGRLLVSSRRLLGVVFPFDEDLTESWLQQSLELLERTGRLVRYQVDGRSYGYLTHFQKHQRISHPSPSRIPGPPPEILQSDSGSTTERLRNNSGVTQEPVGSDSGAAPDDLQSSSGEIPDSLQNVAGDAPESFAKVSREAPESFPDGTGEQGNRGTEEQGISPPSPLPGGAVETTPTSTSPIPTSRPSPAPTSGGLLLPLPAAAQRRRDRAATEAEKAAADQVADLWRRLMVPAGFPSVKSGAWKLSTLQVVARAGEDLEATESLFRRVLASRWLREQQRPDLLWVLRDGRERIEMGRFDRGGGGPSAAIGKPWMAGIDLDGLSQEQVAQVEKDTLTYGPVLGQDTARQLREARHAL